MRIRFASGVLALCLVLGMVAACGGGGGGAGGGGTPAPQLATLKVTVTDQDGQVLGGISVSAGGKSSTTNAQGLATLGDVTPGAVKVKLTGDGYDDGEHDATVAAGDNNLTYKMALPPMAVRDVGDVPALRLRISGQSDGSTYKAEAELAANGDSRWVYDDAEVIIKQSTLYMRPKGESWTRFDGELGKVMSEVYMGVSRVYVDEFREFSSDLAGGNIYSGRLVGQEEANGYPCRVYELSWPGLAGDLSYKVWVISSGQHAGYMTRYSWSQTNVGSVTVDIYDLNADIQIKAPI